MGREGACRPVKRGIPPCTRDSRRNYRPAGSIICLRTLNLALRTTVKQTLLSDRFATEAVIHRMTVAYEETGWPWFVQRMMGWWWDMGSTSEHQAILRGHPLSRGPVKDSFVGSRCGEATEGRSKAQVKGVLDKLVFRYGRGAARRRAARPSACCAPTKLLFSVPF
jgi:hypothetical protein